LGRTVVAAAQVVQKVAAALPVDEDDERLVDALFAKSTASLRTRPLARREEGMTMRAELSAPTTPDGVPASAVGSVTSPYPEEYVLLVGSRLVFHTPRQREAFARYAQALKEPGHEALRLVPPRSRARADAPPVVRGRALSRPPARR